MSSPYACTNENAIRFVSEKEDPYRTPFFRDIDRIKIGRASCRERVCLQV